MATLSPSAGSRSKSSWQRSQDIRIGYVPLIDSAPLLVARAEGLFAKYGVQVRLSEEPGWASIREKLIYNELDAVECLAGLVFAFQFGLGCLSHPVSVPLIMSANGNAITLSKEIPTTILETPAGLKNFLSEAPDHGRPLTLATVHPFSSHYALLHKWLTQQQVIPGRNANIIFLPPSVISRNLAAGTIDGFCVGEPWNSKSILDGDGWSPATSVDLDNGHPEKVLAVSRSFTEARQEEVIALTRALLEACELCQSPDYRPSLHKVLASMRGLAMPLESISRILGGTFEAGHTTPRELPELNLFHGNGINAPTIFKANWIISALRQSGQVASNENLQGFESIFREDLYESALSLKTSPV